MWPDGCTNSGDAGDEDDASYMVIWGLEMKVHEVSIGNDSRHYIITSPETIKKTTEYEYLGENLNNSGKNDGNIINKIWEWKAIAKMLEG